MIAQQSNESGAGGLEYTDSELLKMDVSVLSNESPKDCDLARAAFDRLSNIYVTDGKMTKTRKKRIREKMTEFYLVFNPKGAGDIEKT